MKRYKFFLSVFVLTLSLVFPETFTNYSKSFFGVYGRKASVMGKIDGSSFEAWIYPYKIFHDYKINIIDNGNKINMFSKLSSYNISDYFIKRKFTGESWKIEETIFTSYKNPFVFIVYNINNLNDIELEITFKPDLSPMWPASLGGKFSWWNQKGFFVLSEAKWKNFAFIGFPKGEKEGRLPAHKLPGGKLKYRIKLKKGKHRIIVPISAGFGRYEDIEKYFISKKDNADKELKNRVNYLKDFKENHLNITSSDKDFDFAINSSIMKINFAFVDNPFLGKGLVAGYGLSENSERPGFAWFFGGDGVINSLSILDYGDFATVQKEIEFLFKYQRKDGKIPHEISQGARFINWFKDYGYAYFHGDTSLYFAILLGEYLRYSGDIGFIKRYKNKIKLLMDWIINSDKDRDGIVETKYAGTGASETGPLRKKRIKTDILLAGLSVKSWEELEFIWRQLNEKKRYKISKRFYKIGSEKFESLFWNKGKGYYNYAVKEKGGIDEITIWQAIPMRFEVINRERGKKAGKIISSPLLSSDWGARFLSSKSKYYNPLSYNNGAVWPFLTGFSSMALYKYGNPYHAYSLLKTNINIIKDFDYGYATELLSGYSYIPLDQSVNNQIWSYGTTISAFVEGLLGFSPNVINKTIVLTPSIPFDFKNIDVNNLRIGKGSLDIDYKFKNNQIIYSLYLKNLKNYKLIFKPFIPAKNIKISVNNGNFSKNNILKSDKTNLVFKYSISNYAYPIISNKKSSGDTSENPIISDFKLFDNGFILKVWSKGKSKIKIISDYEFGCDNYNISNKTIELNPEKDWKLKTIQCKKTGL